MEVPWEPFSLDSRASFHQPLLSVPSTTMDKHADIRGPNAIGGTVKDLLTKDFPSCIRLFGLLMDPRGSCRRLQAALNQLLSPRVQNSAVARFCAVILPVK